MPFHNIRRMIILWVSQKPLKTPDDTEWEMIINNNN